MRAMIWKELRENFKWAVVAFLGLLLAQIYALSGSRGDSAPLCNSTFLLTTSFGCALVGLAIGLLQILPELRRDQWASLLHRPVSRNVIFLGKAAAGLALYLVATGLPLLVSIGYTAAPGNFESPFVLGSALPALTDQLLGISFYFAAMLACLVRGRWFGARVMILLGMGLVLIIHVANIYGFIVVPLVALAIMLFAAWGALIANGSMRGMPRAGRISYVLVILIGAQITLAVLAVLLEASAGTNSSPDSYQGGMFRVTTDGHVFYYLERTNGDEVYTDMDGKVVTDEKYIGNAGYEYFCQAFPVSGYSRKHFYANEDWRTGAHYVWPVGNGAYDTESWYYLVRGKYLVGYDNLSRRRVALFDNEGFKSPDATPAPFPGAFWISSFSGQVRPTLLIIGSKVYAVDLSDRTASVMFDAGDHFVIDAERFGGGARFLDGTSGRIAVALDDGIRIFDGMGKPLCAIPWPHDLQRWQMVEIAADKSMDSIYLISRNIGEDGPGLPDLLDEYDSQGHPLHTYSHPPANTAPPPPRLVDRMVQCSLPLGPVFILGLDYKFQNYHIPVQETWRGLLASLAAVATVLAAATFLWARKFGFSAASAARWAAMAFLFGPAGVLTFRLATDWPVRVPCPACRQKRPIDSDHCPHCSHGWLAPQRNGTEILDLPGTPATPAP
jgi:hypothetical protein